MKFRNGISDSVIHLPNATEGCYDIPVKLTGPITKVYISGPITLGNTKLLLNAKQNFGLAEKSLKLQKFLPINPYKVIAEALPWELGYEDCMAVAFALLDISDCIYLLPNWTQSIGACKEYFMAWTKGIPIVSSTKEHCNPNRTINLEAFAWRPNSELEWRFEQSPSARGCGQQGWYEFHG